MQRKTITSKWLFKKTLKQLVQKQREIENQKSCDHIHWIAKCSHCGKILASEVQNSTNLNIKEIVEKHTHYEE